MTKDAGLRVRVEATLRDEFIVACRSQGTAASHVIREFMKAFVRQHAAGQQHALFEHTAGQRPRHTS